MTSAQPLDDAIDRVSQLLLDHIGLRTDPTLRGRVRRAVRDEASERSQDLVDYVATLGADSDALQGLMNRVTVQETAFFRHPEHFDVLANDILPTLPRPMRIWSAACANGQEAYSLAMLMEELDIDGEVVATDLSTDALRRTVDARYTNRELSGLSPARMSAHMRRRGSEWEVSRAVRDRVIVLHHNLLDPLPAAVRTSRAVFCRNVLIYLSPVHARTLLDRIADEFPAPTAVFLGAAETMWQVSDRFEPVPVRNTFLYRATSAGRLGIAARGRSRINSTVADVSPLRPVAPATPPPPPAAQVPQPDRRKTPDRRRRSATATPVPVHAEPISASPADGLAQVGQDAVAAGDYGAAVVAFRKCAYLAPHDPVPQLHLGLALEAAGDAPSAHRAFASARRALLIAGTERGHAGVEGYASGELIRMLDAKLLAGPR